MIEIENVIIVLSVFIAGFVTGYMIRSFVKYNHWHRREIKNV